MSDFDDQIPEDPNKGALKSDFADGHESAEAKGVMFLPDELDIYMNRVRLDAYIFHAKPIQQDIERLDYYWKDHSVKVVKKDGTQLDLGVKIQWLIRPHLKKVSEISIVQTKDGEAIDGFMVPINHIEK